MNKTIILGIFFIFSLNFNAQNSLPVEIILKTQDTLIGDMLIRTNLFYKKLVYATSFNEKLIFFDKINKKRKIKSQEIQELNFIDLKGKKRKFVTNKKFKHHIIEVIYLNKIQWYKHYYTSNYAESTLYVIFDQDGNKFNIGLFNSPRKKLKKITRQNPNIEKFIDANIMTDENILNVIKMYEETL